MQCAYYVVAIITIICTVVTAVRAERHWEGTVKCHKKEYAWDPWVAQQFSACLWPRVRSWRPGIESHIGLLMHGACFSLCLCLCLSFSLSVCVTIINKIKKKEG